VEFFENKVGGVARYDVANASGGQREEIKVGAGDGKNVGKELGVLGPRCSGVGGNEVRAKGFVKGGEVAQIRKKGLGEEGRNVKVG